MKNFKILRLLVFTTFLIFASCTKDDTNQPVFSTEIGENFVNIENAKNIASKIEFPTDKSLLVKKSKFKDIENITEIIAEDGLPSFYIINYKEESFIIISADNRVNPILAYSDSKNFKIDKVEEYPEGLQEWLVTKKKYIQNVRTLNNKQTEEVLYAWKTEQIISLILPPDEGEDPPSGGSDVGEDEGCENTYYIVNPLLQTTWGQLGVYNDLAPNLGCIGDGKALTGCVATAMAQIMKYNEFPTTYNWANMPNEEGTIDTALLMRDIGDAVNMIWGCYESGAYMYNVIPAFKNDFGYSDYISDAYFDSEIVKIQLGRGNPVLLYGEQEQGGGHAWVCDGYRRTIFCETGAVYLLLHMNWGWDNDYNAWYDFNNWSPGPYDFNTNRGMIYNIIP